jgi:hypothetical protein
MKKEFIPYTEALALKELGFDEPCQLGWYLPHSEIAIKAGVEPNYWQLIPTHPLLNQIAAPLYQQAFRWFREKYDLFGTPQYFTGGFYCYTINDMKDTKESNKLFTEFETYEEAELACLEKLIEIKQTFKSK